MTEAERELFAVIIGQQVREHRKRLGLSQIELAQGIGSQSMLSLIESGRQLPLPDVLHLLASKLNDPSLLNYADMLSRGTVTSQDISATDHTVLLDALRAHRGRWQDVHNKVAMQLCEHHYANRIFGTCREICQLIANQSASDPCRAIAYFYHGSSYLFENEYTKAEPLLRTAETLQTHLEIAMAGKLLYNLAYLYTALDVQGMAMWYAKSASDKFAGLHDFEKHAKSLGLLGTIQHRIGLFDDAQATLELAYDIGQKWNLSAIDLARITCTLAGTYIELGQCEQARTWAELSLKSAMECSDNPALAAANRTLFLIETIAGKSEQALFFLSEATELIDSTQKTPYMAHVHLLLIDHLDAMEDKLQTAQKAFDHATATNSPVEAALAAECLAVLYEEQDDPELAMGYRKLALDFYREHITKNTMFRHIIKLLPKSLTHDS